jgi:hypothetical protein
VRNPQAPGPRSRSARCSWRRRYDARRSPIFADHRHSGVLCIQCRQARGGISLVAISVRACMPGQRIFTSRTGYWYTFFNFDLTGGSQGTSPFDLRYHRENGVRQPGNERSRPQLKAHNSVRPLKNGLSLGGSSATSSKGPLKWEGGTTPTYVANVPSQGGRATSPPPPPTLAPNVPTSGGGGGTYVRAERPNVTWQRPTSTWYVVRPSTRRDAHAPHSASELAPGTAAG